MGPAWHKPDIGSPHERLGKERGKVTKQGGLSRVETDAMASIARFAYDDLVSRIGARRHQTTRLVIHPSWAKI